MGWTPQQYAEYVQRRRAAGAQRICAPLPEQGAQPALVRSLPGADQGRPRLKVRFTVYAVRPSDYDNIRIKELQDCLVHAGILDGDEWDVLQGEVISCKAATKAEERTVVEVMEL